MSKNGREVLITTLPPTIMGGVASKAKMLAQILRTKGYTVTVAHYAPIGSENERNATFLGSLIGRKPDLHFYREWDGIAFLSVGCRFPELEATYYYNAPFWPGIIEAHDFHIAVGGNVLPAAPLAQNEVPHLVWCASDVAGDRVDRQAAMGIVRRLYDKAVVMPRLQELEREVLRGGGRFMTISEATAKAIRARVPGNEIDTGLLPIPVDASAFMPPETPVPAGVIGSAGRHTDPRKNTAMLLEAVARARRKGAAFRLRLAGPYSSELAAQAEHMGIGDYVEFLDTLAPEELPDFYRSLDLFAIPSRQEGLNIAGLEAMACGVPVVSTRCGGPEDYVIDSVTGYLCDLDAEDMADKLIQATADRDKRNRLGIYARGTVMGEYGMGAFAQRLREHWISVWEKPPLF